MLLLSFSYYIGNFVPYVIKTLRVDRTAADRKRSTYGYEISQKLQEHGFQGISEGTIYPLLLRMEKNGLIEATYKASVLGPRRKYFTITGKGKGELEDFLTVYKEMERAVHHLFAQRKPEADSEENTGFGEPEWEG